MIPIDSLAQLPALAGGDGRRSARAAAAAAEPGEGGPDLADLRGQRHLRHALEVAAAGGHSLLMIGPPGAGKSMAAGRLPSILPPLGPEEALEVARIASACGRLDGGARRPAVPGAASHDQPGGPGRRRQSAAARARRPWPTAACSSSTSSASSGATPSRRCGRRWRRGWVSIAPGGGLAAAALPVHARRRGQPVSVRARRGRPRVQLLAARDPALPGPAERRPGGPHRHPRRDPPAQRRGDRRAPRRALRRRSGRGSTLPAPARPTGSGRDAATPR